MYCCCQVQRYAPSEQLRNNRQRNTVSVASIIINQNYDCMMCRILRPGSTGMSPAPEDYRCITEVAIPLPASLQISANGSSAQDRQMINALIRSTMPLQNLANMIQNTTMPLQDLVNWNIRNPQQAPGFECTTCHNKGLCSVVYVRNHKPHVHQPFHLLF